jgi:uncharacterized integral membrane protein
MGILKAAVFLVLLAASIGFAVLNDEAVSLRYYFGLESISLPLFLWAFLFLFVGIILAGVAAFLTQIGLLARIRQLKKSVADLERKRNELKSRTAGL